jgi:hypothetical protein
MLTKMPIIHMKLIESKKKTVKGIYSCPCYVYPDRHGTREKASYVMSFDLKVTIRSPLFGVCPCSLTLVLISPESLNLNSG